MKQLKGIALISLFIVVVASGFYIYAQRTDAQGWAKKITSAVAPITSAFSRFTNSFPVMRSFTTAMVDQVSILSYRGQTVGSVLGSVIQVNTEEEKNQSTADRLLEKGQYLYCKQIVDEFEKKK